MGVLAQSMRELIAAMQANEERQRELLTNDLQSIVDRLDDVGKGLAQVSKDLEAIDK